VQEAEGDGRIKQLIVGSTEDMSISGQLRGSKPNYRYKVLLFLDVTSGKRQPAIVAEWAKLSGYFLLVALR